MTEKREDHEKNCEEFAGALPESCAAYGGLFAKYNGEVKDLVMSNTRVASGTGYAGALIGWVDGKTKLENVRVYLSDLSVTKYKTAKEVPGYINGTYAGGMVGLVDTGTDLEVISSASATTVAAANAAGGLVGLVRGTLNVKTAYTDCYLNSRRTGGLVGAAPVGRIYATGFYTAGYQVATAQAAGILPGALKEGSFTMATPPSAIPSPPVAPSIPPPETAA